MGNDAADAQASIATKPANGNAWFVYMIRCDDGSLYTGITTDIARRWEEHRQVRQQRSGRGKVAQNNVVARKTTGAKFFRGRRPLQLAYIESGHDRSSASRREAAIKRLSRAEKLLLVTALHNELHTLDRALLSTFGYS